MTLENVLDPGVVGEKDLAVVPRSALFNGEYQSGVKDMDESELFNLLNSTMQFKERTEQLERDESLKQIIPYFLVRQGDKYLTARRRDKGGDIRLHGGRLIGFGGHLKAGDIKGKMNAWLQREFDEEIVAEKVLGISFLGIVDHDGDEDNGVHKVHFGLLFEIETQGNIRIREEDNFQDEEFLTVEDLVSKMGEMEIWSRLVTKFLAK